MRKFILSILILLSLTSTVYSAQLNGNQIREDYATKAYVNGTIENNVYTKTQTNATIEAAIANATASISINQTISVPCSEDLTVGDVVSLINNYGTVTAKKNNLSVSTSPNGSEYIFNSAATTYCSAVALDSTRFLVAYFDGTNGKGIVGTVSGSSISWGSATTVLANCSELSVCRVATDKIIVVGLDSTDSNQGAAATCTISGNSINAVGIKIRATQNGYGSATKNSVSTLDTDKAIYCYKNSGFDDGRACILTSSGTDTIAAGHAVFNAAATSYISVSALSSTSAIVAYQDGGNSNYGTAQVLSISGTTITPGTEYVFDSHTCFFNCTAALTSTTAIIGWENYQGYQRAVIATNSSGAISYGTAYTSTDGFDSAKIYAINSSKAIAFFSDANDSTSGAGKSAIFNISSTSITRDTAYKFNNAATLYIGGCNLGNTASIVAYQDQGNSSYGTAVVNTWATSDYSSVRGIATANITSGSDAVVLLNGTAPYYTSLITGADYYINDTFGLQTTPVSLNGSYIKIGEAINSNTLFIH